MYLNAYRILCQFQKTFNMEKIIVINNLTRWVKLNDLNFDIINWSVKDKFIDILH